jgi:hypothetical protein
MSLTKFAGHFDNHWTRHPRLRHEKMVALYSVLNASEEFADVA